MRIKFFGSILLSLTVLTPAGFAADRMVIENLPVPKTEQNSSSFPISATIMEDGKLIATAGLPAGQAGPVFTEGGDYSGMTLPYLISYSKLVRYPRWAIKQGWQGRFVIAIEVLLNGTVGRYKVMESTGHRLLDRAATEAVRTWKFKPAMKDGKPVVTCIEIPVIFQLENP